jgi:MFS family permease
VTLFQREPYMQSIRSRFIGLTAELPPMYWFLWLGTLINRFGSFVVPFLTLYFTSQRGISVSGASLMVSLFGIGSFAAQLAGGEMADRLGRRPVMLMSLFVAPIAMIILGFAGARPLIATCMLAVGFFSDLYRPASSAMIADIVPSFARVRAFGYLNWAVNLGFAAAPVLAGFMARYNYLLLFVGDALTTLIFWLIVVVRIQETRPSAASHAKHTSLRERVRQVRQEPILLLFTLLALFVGIIYMQSYVTLPLDMQAHGLTPSDYGLAITVNAILIVLFSIQVSNAAGRWPRFSAMAVAALLLGTGFGFAAFAFTLPMFVLSVVIWTLGEIAVTAVAPAVIADLSPVELRGLYQGIFGSALGLALFLGPALGGWVYERFGPSVLWSACFMLGCLLAISYLSMAGPARKRLEETATQKQEKNS